MRGPKLFSRREVLQSMAALTATVACTHETQAPTAPIPGELYDFGMRGGHALRHFHEHRINISPRRETSKHAVAIIGAGAAGLSCAWRLVRAGFDDFIIYEMSDAAGGTARSGRSPVTAYPFGAHYITAPQKHDVALIALLQEMGVLDDRDAFGEPVAQEQFACRAPDERVFFRGSFLDDLWMHEYERDTDRNARLRFEQTLRALSQSTGSDGRRPFQIPRALSSTDEKFLALDTISFAEWLKRNDFTAPQLLWVCDYACRDDYGTRLQTTSAWAGLFYFCARQTPLGHERQVITWPEGNGALIAHLQKTAQVPKHMRLDATILEVKNGEDSAELLIADTRAESVAPVGDSFVVADNAFTSTTFEHVALCTPHFVRARVLNTPLDTQLETSPWVSVIVHLSEHPKASGVPFAWDTVFRESESLGYVTATHQSGIDRGKTVLTWYFPLVGDDTRAERKRLYASTRDAWVKLALDELRTAHRNIDSLVERVDVCRIGHGMIRPHVGLFRSKVLENMQKPLGRIHFAHTDLSGVALFEEAFFHGVRAAEEILHARNIAFTPLAAGF